MNHNLFFTKREFVNFQICPKLMWLMFWRKDQQIFEWTQQNLFFLDRNFCDKFNSFFKYQKGKYAKNSLEYYAISGIMFEEVIASWWKKKGNFCDLESFFINNFDRDQKIAITKKKLNDKRYQIYFQPYFIYQNFIVKCDFLVKKNNFHFDLYEVKAVNKLKKEYQFDLMYQCWVLRKLGYQIDNAYIIHCNNEYQFETELNVEKLMKISQKFNLPEVKDSQNDQIFFLAKNYLTQKFESIKENLLSPFCFFNFDQKPLKQDYCVHLIKKPFFEHNWLQLYRLTRKKKIALYVENNFEPINLCDFKLKNISLTHCQKRMINVLHQEKKRQKDQWGQKIYDVQLTKTKLSQYQFPLYFYDFETSSFVIPPFKHLKPWQQIPFQFSIHVLVNENYDLENGKNIYHYSFISKDLNDPRFQFCQKFLQIFKIHGQGKGVVYNKSFEKMILQNLTTSSNLSKEQIFEINNIIENTLDLKDLFNNFDIYHKNFRGSLSIKSVLPSFFPNFSYKDLKIQRGDEASGLYFNYIYRLIEDKKWKEDIQSLKEYCKRDTFAMIKIFDYLKKEIEQK